MLNLSFSAHFNRFGGASLSVLFLLFSLAALCPSAARADDFATGEFVTYTQADWSQNPDAVKVLTDNFTNVYSTQGGTLVVGVGTSLFFDSASAVNNYLPTSGAVAPLDQDQEDPLTTSSGAFGGDVTALALDVDFSAAGLLGTSSTPYGDLLLTGFDLQSGLSGLNGMSISDLLAIGEAQLGGSSNTYDIDDLDAVIAETSSAFPEGATISGDVVTQENGTVDLFAADHLEFPSVTGLPNPNTPVTTPEPSIVVLLGVGLLALGIWQHGRFRGSSIPS